MKIHEVYIKYGQKKAKDACWEFFEEMYNNTVTQENK